MKRNNEFGLSRRKVLGGLGMIGLASAGAGLGTTAYFSDEESFEDNELTAGSLDLKLDYKATYSGGPGRRDDIDALYPDFEVQDLGDGTYLIGEVPEIEEGDIWEEEVQETDLCAPDLNLINGDEVPVFTLEDVKPGDSGEVTVSLHICDNPAWVYMNGELTENAENDYTEPEPETEADGDINDPGDSDGEGELADAIQTTLWYDENCNNIFEPGGDQEGDPVCVELVLDASGSMSGTRNTNTISGAKNLAGSILNDGPAGSEVGVTFFSASGYSSDARIIEPLTDDLGALESAIDGLPANGGSTAIGNGIAAGQADLDGSIPSGEDWDDELSNGVEGCDHDNRVMVVFTDGSNNSGLDPATEAQAAKDAGTEIFAIGVGGANQSTLNAIASSEDHVFLAADDAAIEQIFAQVAQTITSGEQVIASGSLADVMAELEVGLALDGDRTSEDRDPFVGGMTHCLGFEWEVPENVGNEIQTDSVKFDLGFYALQSRHLDNPPENPFDGNFTDANGLPTNSSS